MDYVARHKSKSRPAFHPSNNHSPRLLLSKQAADMGPKSVAATCASAPPTKDLSWIDRMYMKFETMCVEVDKNPSLLLQETSKYVESQVNAVGVNVKKLCTELIQDLIATPMLSPEGTEKKLECALHCKCHCMDSERLKLNGTDTAGFDGGDGSFKSIVLPKEDIMKKEGSKVENVKKEVSKVEIFNKDIPKGPQNSKSFEVCSRVFNNIHGQNGTINGETLDMQSEMEDIGGLKSFEQKTEGSKTCAVRQGETSGTFEGKCRNSDQKENKMTSEGSMREAAVCTGEAVFAENACKPKANEAKEAVGPVVSSAIYRNSATEGSQEKKGLPRMLEPQQEMQARNAQSLSKTRPSDVQLQETASHLTFESISAKYKVSECTSDSMLVEELKKMDRVSGSFQSMCSDDFSELPSSTKEEEPTIMLEWFSKEDEEQSAHWLVGEDFRKALEPGIFSNEKSPHGECLGNEFDLDWELL